MFEYELPDVGEGVAEGELIEWHVEPGDTVAENEVIAEVETDKAVVDVPSPVDGEIVELHWDPGDVVPVGESLVTIDTGEEPTGDEDVAAEPGTGDGAAGGAAGTSVEDGDGASPDEEVPAGGTASNGDSGRVFAPPSVRRLAREQGVDLATVDGSGPGGRITRGDVEAAAAGSGGGSTGGDAVTAEPAAETGTGGPGDGAGTGGGGAAAVQATADRERTLAAPATRKLARELDVDLDAVPTDETRDGQPFVTPEQVRAVAEGGATAAGGAAAGAGETAASAATPAGGETREPYRGIRRTIGKKMEESAYTAPHVSHHESVEVSALVDARAAVAERAPQDVSVTYMPFVLKAVVEGLKEYPIVNSELQAEGEGDTEEAEIVKKHYYNIGVATATDRGLLVPVVDAVDEKGLFELAREVNRLTTSAREGDIAREEMQGGTFSVTNFGAIGGEYATPIINYPETAILGLGAIEERPWVEDGDVVARPVLPLSLSIDHRVIDGAEAAQFVNTVAEYLETPSLLLLD